MKTTVSEHDFIAAFQDIRPDNFSHDGLRALYEYLTEYEESTGDELELDVVGVCCDFTEYADWEEFSADYGDDYTPESLQDETVVIELPGDGFIIQTF